MSPADGKQADRDIAVFSVASRVVVLKRASEIGVGVFGIVMIAAFFPWGGPPPPDSIDHIVWPLLAVGIGAPAVFVWFRWKRIPPDAPGGTLHVGPAGIDYRIGPDHVRLTWEQIAAVHPITRAKQQQVVAVWLPREDPAPPGSSRMTLLEIAHLKNPYRPVQWQDGIVLPLRLLGPDRGTAFHILAVMRRQLATAKGLACGHAGLGGD